MKKFAILLATVATLTSNGAFAQGSKQNNNMGCGAQAGTYSATSVCFAWGIAIGALVVVGLVVGFAAGAGAQSSNSSN